MTEKLELDAIPFDGRLAELRLEQAAKDCLAQQEPLTFGNICLAAMLLDNSGIELSPFSLPWYEEQVYQIVEAAANKYGIILFSDELDKLLVIDGGVKRSYALKEALGYLISSLPQTWQRLTAAKSKATYTTLDMCERGIVGRIDVGNQALVVKAARRREIPVATLLGEKGIGPQVYESSTNPAVLAEEFIAGPRVLDGKVNPIVFANNVGQVAFLIHHLGVVYGDRFWDHLFWEKDGVGRPLSVRLIDFSSARFGKDFETDWQQAEKEVKDICKGNLQALRVARGLIRSWQDLDPRGGK